MDVAISPFDYRIFLSRQFAAFVVVGLVAAALHWIYRIVINTFVGYEVALVIAYGLSLVSGFLLMRRYVFPQSTKPVSHQARYFVVFQLAMFPVVYGLSYALSEWVFARWMAPGSARALGHGLAILTPAVISFVLQKFIAFEA